MNTNIDHYSVLGLDATASDQQIKEAYRKLAKALHPDKNKDDKEFYTSYFQILNEAKDVLLDTQKKYQCHSFTSNGGNNAALLREIDKQKKEIRSLHQELFHVKEELKKSKTQQTTRQELLNTQEFCNMLVHDTRALKEQLANERKTKNQLALFCTGLMVVFVITCAVFIGSAEKSPSAVIPFSVKDITFSNSADSTIYTHVFVKKSVRYVNPIIRLDAFLQERRLIGLTIKFINPDGTLSKYPADSKDKFSFRETIQYDPNIKTISLHGWGNKSKSFFLSGEHAVEIWYGDRILGKGAFIVLE